MHEKYSMDADHPDEVLGPCPPRCEGFHAESLTWGVTQFHATAPLVLSVVMNENEHDVAHAQLMGYPESQFQPKPFVFVEFTLDCPELGPDGVTTLADALDGWLPKVRQLSARLAEIQAQDPGDPTMTS